jgi:hypothetical protein
VRGKKIELDEKHHYGGIIKVGRFSYPYILLVKFNITVESTSFWESNYKDSQVDLFEKIRGYKEDILTPIGYRKISKIFNDEGVLTPEGHPFSPSHVFGIYKKGLIRLERIIRPDVILVTPPVVEVFKTIYELFNKFNQKELL